MKKVSIFFIVVVLSLSMFSVVNAFAAGGIGEDQAERDGGEKKLGTESVTVNGDTMTVVTTHDIREKATYTGPVHGTIAHESNSNSSLSGTVGGSLKVSAPGVEAQGNASVTGTNSGGNSTTVTNPTTASGFVQKQKTVKRTTTLKKEQTFQTNPVEHFKTEWVEEGSSDTTVAVKNRHFTQNLRLGTDDIPPPTE